MERATRAALLIDGAAYFSAAKAALMKAHHSILLLGWTFDPRTPLLPDVEDPSGQDTIGALLVRLKEERNLDIRILIWNMTLSLAAGHDFFPQRARRWFKGRGVNFALDKTVPFGACHHQKVLVVDDQIAFCGSADFAPNRWDTLEHPDESPLRILPSGRPYPPRHEAVMMVDGDAARALGNLARERWRRATGEWPGPPGRSEVSDYWPEHVVPDMRDVPVGIVRTSPSWKGAAGIREAERLYLEAIASAHRLIFLENQYFASKLVGDALAARLTEPDGPEVVVICSRHSPGFTDSLVMDSSRDALLTRLNQADRFGRLRAYAPHTAGGRVVIVHSKLAIFDGELLLVGSTNLNNRSLGYDTECDLAIEAEPGTAGEHTRKAIAWCLGHVVGHYLACQAEAVLDAMRDSGRLAAAVDALDSTARRRLCPLAPAESLSGSLIAKWHLGDPLDASDAWRPWRRAGRQSALQGPRQS